MTIYRLPYYPFVLSWNGSSLLSSKQANVPTWPPMSPGAPVRGVLEAACAPTPLHAV